MLSIDICADILHVEVEKLGAQDQALDTPNLQVLGTGFITMVWPIVHERYHHRRKNLSTPINTREINLF